jgi:hypothetical protein
LRLGVTKGIPRNLKPHSATGATPQIHND